VERACGDGLSAAVVVIVALVMLVNGREKDSTPGNAGSWATDGVVRCTAILGRQRSTGKISGLAVVDGSVRSYVRSMADEPGRGLSGGGDDDSVLVAVFGWHRDGGGRAVLAGQVVTFDMSGSGAVNRWGPRSGMCTDGAGGKLESGELAHC